MIRPGTDRLVIDARRDARAVARSPDVAVIAYSRVRDRRFADDHVRGEREKVHDCLARSEIGEENRIERLRRSGREALIFPECTRGGWATVVESDSQRLEERDVHGAPAVRPSLARPVYPNRRFTRIDPQGGNAGCWWGVILITRRDSRRWRRRGNGRAARYEADRLSESLAR